MFEFLVAVAVVVVVVVEEEEGAVVVVHISGVLIAELEETDLCVLVTESALVFFNRLRLEVEALRIQEAGSKLGIEVVVEVVV